jgi:hapalindole H/12-epi-hapalindole U/12-epi-fischerindole U synthase
MKQTIKSLIIAGIISQSASAAILLIDNPGFEDISGQGTFGEFTLDTPNSWDVYDPFDIHPSAGLFLGTLMPNGVEFFNTVAPEGDRVAILFNSSRRGEGEYGITQVLTDTLQANTLYTLTVEVGNIASGTDLGNTFYNLNGNPGYRVELLAGGVLLSSDDNGLIIPEGEFALSTVTFMTDGSHAQLGQTLEIRLINENIQTFDPNADLEIDFDDVRLSAVAIPEPSSVFLIAIAAGGLLLRRKR